MRPYRGWKVVLGLITTSAGLLAGSGALWAQATGTIAGQVTNGETSEPIVGAQVLVQGTQNGTVTNAEGRFLLLNVAAGTQTVSAQLIGYTRAEGQVEVTAGGTGQLALEITPQAIALEGIVATGTPIAAQRREIGNSIALITAQEIETAAVTSFEDLLRGRALGVNVVGTPGQAGAGARIMLRGVHSLLGRNQPLIYVDGIRMSGGVYEADNEAGEAATILGDLDPANIERVEIIKGAAASTLYGTEGSSGVIQVFTKSGVAGDPRWTFSTEHGVARVGHVGPDSDPTGLHVNDCTMDPGCPESGSWLRDAYQQEYRLSVRGGSEDITYYVSGGFGRQQGVIDPQHADNMSFRGNFTFTPAEDLSIQLNNVYTRRYMVWVPNGDNDEGLLWNVARGDQGETPDNDDSVVLDMELDQEISHVMTGANINWTPATGFRHRLNVGLDQSTSTSVEERPWGFWDFPEGTRTVDIEGRQTLTFDYAGSWHTGLPFDLESTLSWGGQMYQRRRTGLRTDVEGFIGPGDKLIESGRDITNANEEDETSQSGGIFLQEMLGWQNRLFITAGLRADSHSAFGDDYDLSYGFTFYPKLQATYTLSDHDFWPSWWETMRLRAAYGEAGDPPPPESAVRYWEVAGADENELGYIIFNQGNANIGPERSREFEFGLDGSLLNGRATYTLTYYDRKTNDGLVGIDPPPSNGIAEQLDVNIGTWTSAGIESALDLMVYDGDNIRWSVRGRYSKRETEMLFFGLEADGQWGLGSYNNFYQVGYPMPAMFEEAVINADSVGQLPVYTDTTVYMGPTYPPVEFSLGTTLTLFDRLTLDVFGTGQRGHVAIADMAQETTAAGFWPTCSEINTRVENDDYADLTAREIARCSSDYSTNGDWVFPADFFRLTSASVNYRLPEGWLPGGLTSGVLQFKAGNIAVFTDFPGVDPGGFVDSASILARGTGYILPPPQTYTLTLRATF